MAEEVITLLHTYILLIYKLQLVFFRFESIHMQSYIHTYIHIYQYRAASSSLKKAESAASSEVLMFEERVRAHNITVGEQLGQRTYIYKYTQI